MTATEPAAGPLFDEAFLRRLERLAVVSRRAMAGQMQGERRSPRRGQSVEFADFRPYTPGDDVRRIDWNAYARLERFFLKLFVAEEDLTVNLVIDASRSMDWGQPHKLRYALRAAGALGYVALAGLDRATVTVLGGAEDGRYFPPHRGKQQAHALFHFLSGIEAGGAVDLGPALLRIAARPARPGPLILLSDLFDAGRAGSTTPAAASGAAPPWTAGLHALAARGYEVTLLHILAPEEVEPELAGDLKLLDSETGAGVEVTADAGLLERYRRGLAAWQEGLGRYCGARGMQYVPVETTLPAEELLFAWLRQRGVLR